MCRCSYGDLHAHVFLPVLELEDLPSRQALRVKARCRSTSAASGVGGGASVSRRERIVGPTASSLPLAVTHTYSDTHANMLQLPCLAAVVVTLMASCASGDTGKRAENSFHEFSERVKVAVTPGAVQRVGEF